MPWRLIRARVALSDTFNPFPRAELSFSLPKPQLSLRGGEGETGDSDGLYEQPVVGLVWVLEERWNRQRDSAQPWDRHGDAIWNMETELLRL